MRSRGFFNGLLVLVYVMPPRGSLVISDDNLKFGQSLHIPWDAIQSVKLVSVLGAKFLGVKLKPGKDFAAPVLVRWFVRYWPPRKGNDLIIDLDGLTMTAEEIMLLIENRLATERNG